LTGDELTALLRTTPGGRITVWAVLYEDIYETSQGDGYYAYLADAFFRREDAELFAVDSSSYRFHVRRVDLSLHDDKIIFTPIDLKPSESVSSSELIAALSVEPARRTPRAQY
jgi:hypothetical protein